MAPEPQGEIVPLEDPLPADIRDVLTIKHEGLFLLSDRFGDIEPHSPAALGMYFRDTRFLSRWELRVDGKRFLPLHAEADRNYSMLVEGTMPRVWLDDEGKRHSENLQVSRHRWLECGMHEVIKLQNFGAGPRTITLELAFGADFLDLFQVRGFDHDIHGTVQATKIEGSRAILDYQGRDGVHRATEIDFHLEPGELHADRAIWRVTIEPRSTFEIEVAAQPHAGEAYPPQLTHDELDREYARWRKSCTRIRVSNTQLQAYIDRSIADLRMMQTMDAEGLPAIDAGVPWFSTLFGRDALITAYQTLAVNPDLAKGTLEKLAQLQGNETDDWRDEEPGKILHEVRVGELAAIGEIPHTPYYGSIDATPLWLVVLGYVWNWTGDREFVERMWPHALRALEWIDRHGDADGDGYVEYHRRSGRGLDNQGWKDSFDGILGEDGTIPSSPIALAEVQGYVYDAKRRIARLAKALGHDDLCASLEEQAAALKERFNRDFWCNDLNVFAVGLDGDKHRIRAVASNTGHCLWSGIVEPALAVRMARRLMQPDMLSGWGIRTLSSMNPGFDPIGYHTGSVWPHDNSLIAHGLAVAGFTEESNRVIDELALAGAHFEAGRYPELFCGYAREEVPVPVQYPVACRPQAWATGAPLLMMRSYAGMSADAPNKTLSIQRPSLPMWLERAEMIGLRVGDARVDLLFTQRGGTTGVSVTRKDGDLDVVVRY